MTEADGRIPLTILGGFLGAGKSSWLRHQLYVGTFSGAHVLVNEAAEMPVDHLLLVGAAGLSVLADGCACCDGAVRFVAEMRDLCDKGVASIVLETSGLSDPARIAACIAADGVLARRIRVIETVVVADALNAPAQLETELLWIRQIEAADRIVLTKVDVAKPDSLSRLAATMKVINPSAELSGAVLGSAANLPETGGVEPLAIFPPVDESGPIRTLRLDVGVTAGWAAVSVWLSAILHAHGDDLVRVKGVVRTPAGRLLLQAVRGTVQPPEMLPETLARDGVEEDVIVLIGRGFDDCRMRRNFMSAVA